MTKREYKSQDEKAADAFDEWCDQAFGILEETPAEQDYYEDTAILDERLAHWHNR